MNEGLATAAQNGAVLRCVRCDGRRVVANGPQAGYRCDACGADYPLVMGVPYFGDFERVDAHGLIEIAANAVNRGRFGITPAVVERVEELAGGYHAAADKAAFAQAHAEAQVPDFANRYAEWLQFERIAGGLDLAGKQVLDIGAGLGFDSHRLALRGAHVTALEFSPLLAESGRENFPHIRWIGGFSHCLPFAGQSFDFVFCNAALHHMRDVPAALREALRVLRPGGVLVTTADSFRPDTSTEADEVRIFDRDASVLMGVNEGVPRFSQFTSALLELGGAVDVQLFTTSLYDREGASLSNDLQAWPPETWDELAHRSGSLALRVTRTGGWDENAPRQGPTALSAAAFARLLDSASTAIASLAPLVPDEYVDLPFPGEQGSKFELLNGWHMPQPFRGSRLAYRRGRWFLRRPAQSTALDVEVTLPPSQPNAGGTIVALLDGVPCARVEVGRGAETVLRVDVSSVPAGRVFAIELQFEAQDMQKLEAGEFEVLSRRFVGPDDRADEPITVFAVIPVFNRLHFTRACVERLKAQTWKHLRIIVSDGGSTDGTVAAIRAEFPGVQVLETSTELWWTGAMERGIDAALAQSTRPGDAVLMMNNDTLIPDDYVERLVVASRRHEAAVGALVVDSRDASRVLDAGEYVDWATYTFPVRSEVLPGERFRDDVDVLPGRGSLVPLAMVRAAGNVDSKLLPHYLADYEFFTRLKRHGFRLGVTYETRILAHIEETGIVPTTGTKSFRAIWRELFSRRSMSNVIDHWRYVNRHAPAPFRGRLRRRLARRVLLDFLFRTRLRPVFMPFYWALSIPWRVRVVVDNQRRVFRKFFDAVDEQGSDVLCAPQEFPRLIRMPLFLSASPGPLHADQVRSTGLDLQALLQQGVLRPLSAEGWYAFATLKLAGRPQAGRLRALFLRAWNPPAKIYNTWVWRKLTRPKETT